jgi:hypothetical protein
MYEGESIRTYLDGAFTSYQDLVTKVDSEFARLKSREAEIEAQIEVENDVKRHAAEEAVEELRAYFQWLQRDKNTEEPVQGPAEMPVLIKSGALPSEVAKEYEKVKSLMDARMAFVQVSELEKLVGMLQNTQDIDKSLDLYSQILQIEPQLMSINTVARLFARKSLDVIQNWTLGSLQETVQSNLRAALKQNHWPKQSCASNDVQEALTNCLKTETIPTTSSVRPEPLKSFAILAENFETRFRFHYQSDRSTNRVDKPEWMFHFVAKEIQNQVPFLTNVAQPALKSVPRLADRNAVHEFIAALLPVIHAKLRSVFPEAVESPYVVSHLLYEIIQFDDLLEEKFFFVPYGRTTWRGVSGDILAENDWFNKWLAMEKEIAVGRYKEIVEAPNAWEIDWEGTDPRQTKPTVSALNVRDLLEGITEHYNSLRSVSYRLRFLLDIQINILDRYYQRLADSIAAFDSMSSSLARAVGGVSADDAKRVSGVDGLQRLCRIYGSLDYIASALGIWGQELFFLELWQDISKLNKTDKKTTEAFDKATTANFPDNEEDEGTLFDETISSYSKLKERIALTIHSHLRKELQHSMKTYFRYTDWQPETVSGSISPKLVQPIKALTQLLSLLRRFHTPNDFDRVSRSFANDLQKYVWNFIIQANQFSRAGGSQLAADISEIWTSLALPRGRSFRLLEQACMLLCGMDESAENICDLTEEEVKGILKRRV